MISSQNNVIYGADNSCGVNVLPHKLSVSLMKKKEVSVLFNNTADTFYLWLYGIRDIVKGSSNGSFISTIPQTREHILRPLLN